MITSWIFAYENNATSVDGNFSTKAVNIEVKQLENNNGVISEFTNKPIINIDNDISMIPRITNLGIDCYVRAKIEFYISNSLNDDYVIDIDSNWIKQGEYYYYKNILETGKTLDLFTVLKLNNKKTYIGQNAIFNITIDAVQAKNFDVDFNRDNIWEYTDITECTDHNYKVDSSTIEGNTIINYDDNSLAFLSIPDNFFAHISELLPGDPYSETIKIKNTSKSIIGYYLKTSFSENSLDTLRKINLVITDENEEKIYDGSLLIGEKIYLGDIDINNTKNYKFEITIPKDIDNEYFLKNAYIKWNFQLKGAIINPPTGDNIMGWIALFCFSLIGFITTILLEKKYNKKLQFERN